jgi:indolepyruvate ferredoxin oxidoreductase
LDEVISYRADELVAYQNEKLAARSRDFVGKVEDVALREAVAKSYHKLLAYKDEYEVARLHAANVKQMVAENFDNVKALRFHLAPPILPGKTADGRPKKRKFGPWILNVFKLLRKGKALRGTPLDLFGYTSERRMERALIKEFEADVAEVLPLATPATQDLVQALLELPMQIRGFGPVKQQNAATVAKRREELLAAIRSGGAVQEAAAE